MTSIHNTIEKRFIELADHALQLMKQQAEKMAIKGVGVVCLVPGSPPQSWISKMVVAGASSNDGYNFIGIAYAKVAEMAETLQDCGISPRKVKVGEFDFIGGLIQPIAQGYLLVSFSGASGEEDLAVSQTAMAWLTSQFD